MQQRGPNTATMDEEIEDENSPPQSRFRRNSKLKVLVRSHAMREEQSPPREPSSPRLALSPCIKLTPSPLSSPVSCPINPLVILSPSVSHGNSPSRSPVCLSPTSTLVPSPNNRCSPQQFPPSPQSPHRRYAAELSQQPPPPPQHCHLGCHSSERESSPVYANKVNNRNNSERDREVQTEMSSHINGRKRYICDCSARECNNCGKQERNINNNLTNVNNNVNANTLSVGRLNSRGKLKHQGSSQSSFESSSNSPCLSRDSSSDQYTDTTGVDLEIFIPETLNRNAKDRALMLRIEQELVNLAKDKIKTHFKFPPMSSYQRMLVHRCAAYFGMDHNIESSGKCVVVNKTKNTRIPEIEFKEHIKEDIVFSEEPRRSILKRDSNSIEDYSFKSPDRQYSLESSRRSKSFEEREEEYEKVRRRIFNKEMHESSSLDDFVWSEVPWSSTDSETSSRYRLQPPELHRRYHGKLLKVQSEEMGETLRPHVAKSYSFGGYGLSRGDSVVSTHGSGPRILSKQDSSASSVSWRLSPSSSGYKSQSQMSESVTPSPTSTPHLCKDKRQDSYASEICVDKHDNTLVWAVTDIDKVPKGCVIINPQSGQPLKNEDGSLYLYDPDKPPARYVRPSKSSPVSPQKNQSCQTKIKPSPPISPKKFVKTSPVRKFNLINSSTSPSLPYSPPVTNNSFQFAPTPAEAPPPHQQQQFSTVYNGGYSGPPTATSVDGAGVPIYQQPCIVYGAPYGVPVQQHYEGRISVESSQMQDMTANYFLPENSSTPANSQIVYQQTSPSYWNQQPVNFYANQQTSNLNSPRYPVPMQPQPTGCLAGYGQNYMPQTPVTQPATDLVPVYPNQQVQFVFSNPLAPPPNTMVFPNQSQLIYNQTTAPSIFQQHAVSHYPQNSSTPNSLTSSQCNQFASQMSDLGQQSYVSLTQSMGQMNLAQVVSPSHPNGQQHAGYLYNKMPQSPFDFRHKAGTPKGNKTTGGSKGILLGSSQSSTGTNSPAATVVAGYCPQNPGMYRTPPETPPAAMMNYGPNVIPPVIFRPMGGIRAGTPNTNRSSVSPISGGEISHYDRQRMSLPPGIYHGMPYVIQPDARVIAGRGQPCVYRQPPPLRQHSYPQSYENRSHNKGRKPKKYELSSLPPTGKHF